MSSSGKVYFYPRSPCGERPILDYFSGVMRQFLSTLSLRRATSLTHIIGFLEMVFLSTLSLRRATRARLRACLGCFYFYPRSPCGERQAVVDNIVFVPGFLSTLSLRRATSKINARRRVKMISIHALLAESDVVDTLILADPVLFLSTLSLRRATINIVNKIKGNRFLSTLSLRRATLRVVDGSRSSIISIHALLAESDGFCSVLS